VPTGNTRPTETWNGLPEGYKFSPFLDMEHNDRTDAINPWSEHGQYGVYMGINDATINGFGCGPAGPLDCNVGTSPSQHFKAAKGQASLKAKVAPKGAALRGKRPLQSLAPVPTGNTRPTETWNGLPEGYKFSPFLDMEHNDRTDAINPWSEHGQYGVYMGINDATINGFGCGPAGPLDCNVGTSPSQHFKVSEGQRLLARRPVYVVRE